MMEIIVAIVVVLGISIGYQVICRRKKGKSKDDLSTKELRKLCRDYAQKWVNAQKEDWQQKTHGRLSFLCDGIAWLNGHPQFKGRFFSPSHLEVKEGKERHHSNMQRKMFRPDGSNASY